MFENKAFIVSLFLKEYFSDFLNKMLFKKTFGGRVQLVIILALLSLAIMLIKELDQI